MKAKYVLVILGTLLIVGCGTPSYYVSRSTNDENVVSATGRAAENAALVNTTHRGTPSGYSPSMNRVPNRNRYNVQDQVIQETQRSFTYELNNAIRQQMRDLFQ